MRSLKNVYILLLLLFYCLIKKKQGLSVVSLDKSLEINQVSARIGDNVEIKCDVNGSPSPPIIWRRNGIDLTTLNEDEVRIIMYYHVLSIIFCNCLEKT